MSSLTDEIMADIAAGGRLAEATAQGLREELHPRPGEITLQCRCAQTRGGCDNPSERGRQLCANCRQRGCTPRPGTVELAERPKQESSLKGDLMHAAQIVDAFRQDCVGPRPDLEALALRLRTAAPMVGR